MKAKAIFPALVCLCLVFASNANASVIAAYTMKTGDVHQLGQSSGSYTNIWLADYNWTNDYKLFNGLDSENYAGPKGIDLFANVGKTFWASSNLDDPDYNIFIEQITDGYLDRMFICIVDRGGSIGYQMPLANILNEDENYFTDLHAYNIDRIGLTIDSATYRYDPDATYKHVYSFQVTCTIEGNVVPEPSSLISLVGLSIVFIIMSQCTSARRILR